MKFKTGLGVFGGTFSPPHVGHLRIVAELCSLPFIRNFHVVPTWKTTYKDTKISFDDRFNMASIAFEAMPKVYVMDIMAESRLTYTYELINEYKIRYKEPLYLFLGSDWDVNDFKNAEFIKDNCTVIYFNRGERFNLDVKSGEVIVKEPTYASKESVLYYQLIKNFNISSTEIRSMIKKGQPIDGLVPDLVLNYIRKEKLYGSK